MRAVRKFLICILLLISAVFLTASFLSFSKAYAYSPIVTVKVGDKTYDFSGEELAFYKGNYYIKCLEDVVDYIYYDTLVSPIDASVKFFPESEEKFIFTKESIGFSINKRELIDDINEGLLCGNFNVLGKLYEMRPKITVETLKTYTYKRGEFTTDYKNSKDSRKRNIELAVKKINGTVLSPNEKFSFNKVVGERSEENGFLSAIVIENGQYQEGVGGGVCQVSSTLYNCALLSGLTVTKRFQHSIQSSYVEPSFDAMVSYNACDLEFINDTGGAIFVSAYADGEKIKFTFYGEKPKYTYQREWVEISKIDPPKDEIIPDENLFVGETIYLRRAKNGLKSEGYLVVYENGKKIKTIKLSSDAYKSISAQIKVGVKPITDDVLIDNACFIS